MVLPLGHQKQEFSSRFELDAHGSLTIEFSIRKITLQVLFSRFLYAVGMGGIRNRGGWLTVIKLVVISGT